MDFNKGDLVCVRAHCVRGLYAPRMDKEVIHYAVVLRVIGGRAPRYEWARVCFTNGTKGKVFLDDLEKVNDGKI